MEALRLCGRLVRTIPAMIQVRPVRLSAMLQPVPFRHSSTNQDPSPKSAALKSLKPLLPEGTTLPHTIEYKGERLRVENITVDRAEAAWNILNEAIGKGEGYSRDEIETLEEFRANILKKNNYFEVIHEDDDDIIASIKLVNSPLSRSEKSVHFSGPVVMNEKYRSKRYGSAVLHRIYTEVGRTILGYPGITVARTVVARSIHAVVNAGSVFNGMIPNCSFLEGTGRIMDLIFSIPDSRHITKALANAPVPALPPLVVMDQIPEFLQSSNPPMRTLPALSINGLNLNVENAAPEDVWQVEQMIRQAAQDADGFAIDEFTKDGHFNRKLLFKSHVVVVKTEDDSIAAAAIFGPSRLCRAYNPEQMGGYLLVNPAFRRRGVGSALLKNLLIMSKEVGATSILSDAFACNIPAQQFMDKMGFIITGTMPHCGYVLGRGYRPSYMYWRSV